MFVTIIGTLHILLAVFISLFPFIFKKSWFDYIFVLYTFSVVFLWTCFNGECFITYLIKKYKNPSYISGQNMQFEMLFTNSLLNKFTDYFFHFMNIVWMFSFYIVMTRNKYPAYISISFIFLWLIYTFFCYTFENRHENTTYHLYQKIIQYCLIIIFGFTIYYTKFVYA